MNKLILAIFGNGADHQGTNDPDDPQGACRLIISDFSQNGNTPETVSVTLRTDACNILENDIIRELLSEDNRICIVASEDFTEASINGKFPVCKSARTKNHDSPIKPLSRKEREVLKNLSDGLEYKEIALKSGRSIHTVKNHVSHIYSKLDVKNVCEAIDLYKKMGE